MTELGRRAVPPERVETVRGIDACPVDACGAGGPDARERGRRRRVD